MSENVKLTSPPLPSGESRSPATGLTSPTSARSVESFGSVKLMIVGSSTLPDLPASGYPSYRSVRFTGLASSSTTDPTWSSARLTSSDVKQPSSFSKD